MLHQYKLHKDHHYLQKDYHQIGLWSNGLGMVKITYVIVEDITLSFIPTFTTLDDE
jgi:hypothetical protein